MSSIPTAVPYRTVLGLDPMGKCDHLPNELPTWVCPALPHHDHAMACHNHSLEERDRDRDFGRGGFYAVAVKCHVCSRLSGAVTVRWAKAEATTVEASVQVDLWAV
jgi:hypothetical protein